MFLASKTLHILHYNLKCPLFSFCKEKQILESNGACCHSGLMNNHELVSYAANKVTNVIAAGLDYMPDLLCANLSTKTFQ